MAKGKFSQPRDRSEESRAIEQTFRQVTGQEEPQRPAQSPSDYPAAASEPPFPADPEPEEEFYEEEEPDFWERLLDYVSKNKKIVLVAVCAVVLIAILGTIAFVLIGSAADPYDGKILNNVVVAGVNVGGMTKSEAEAAVERVTDQTFTREDMVVALPEETLRLSPSDTGAKLDVKAAVKAAYNYGRTGSSAERDAAYEASLTGNYTIGLLPYLNLDEEYIQGQLEEYASQFGSVLTQSTYEMEGDMPELEADKFDENAPCQTLLLTIGTPGLALDIDAIYNQILDAYSFNRFLVEVEEAAPEAVPDPLDLDAIYAEVCREPVNASVDMQSYEPIPGVYGYEFDLEKAKELVSQAEYGDTIGIPMTYVEPEILDEEVFFRDVLGEYRTAHTNNENRNTNLRLACEALNGLVLNPGEEFSYNEALGERTAEKGYKPAPAYSGIKTIDSIGGGICQGSSTLYYCVLLADLEVTFRVNHGFVSSYIPYGLDATVSWGYPDFKFKNNTNFPIQIVAEMSGGYVSMQILGTDERDYYVKMEYVISSVNDYETEYEYYEFDNEEGYEDGDVIQNGVTGYYVKTYKCKYNKETDELISRDFEANSTYKTVNKIIAVVEPEETEPETEPSTEATEPSTEATEPPTEATEPPTQATEPSTEATEPPTQATEPPTETTAPPTQETEAPTEATTAPTQATEAPPAPEGQGEGNDPPPEGGDA